MLLVERREGMRTAFARTTWSAWVAWVAALPLSMSNWHDANVSSLLSSNHKDQCLGVAEVLVLRDWIDRTKMELISEGEKK